jgi:hypothetical protein
MRVIASLLRVARWVRKWLTSAFHSPNVLANDSPARRAVELPLNLPERRDSQFQELSPKAAAHVVCDPRDRSSGHRSGNMLMMLIIRDHHETPMLPGCAMTNFGTALIDRARNFAAIWRDIVKTNPPKIITDNGSQPTPTRRIVHSPSAKTLQPIKQ